MKKRTKIFLVLLVMAVAMLGTVLITNAWNAEDSLLTDIDPITPYYPPLHTAAEYEPCPEPNCDPEYRDPAKGVDIPLDLSKYFNVDFFSSDSDPYDGNWLDYGKQPYYLCTDSITYKYDPPAGATRTNPRQVWYKDIPFVMGKFDNKINNAILSAVWDGEKTNTINVVLDEPKQCDSIGVIICSQIYDGDYGDFIVHYTDGTWNRSSVYTYHPLTPRTDTFYQVVGFNHAHVEGRSDGVNMYSNGPFWLRYASLDTDPGKIVESIETPKDGMYIFAMTLVNAR